MTTHTVFFSLCRLRHSTFESTLSYSLSDLMKRFASARMGPCLFLVCFSSVTCLSLVIWISSHNMLHRAQLSHVKKKRTHHHPEGEREERTAPPPNGRGVESALPKKRRREGSTVHKEEEGREIVTSAHKRGGRSSDN